MTSIGTLFAFVIVCGGVWIMRRKQPDVHRPFRTPLVPLIPILGIGWNFPMMYALGASNWIRLVVWLVIGQVIFFTYGRHHSGLRKGRGPGFALIDRVLAAANLGFLVGTVAGFLDAASNAGRSAARLRSRLRTGPQPYRSGTGRVGESLVQHGSPLGLDRSGNRRIDRLRDPPGEGPGGEGRRVRAATQSPAGALCTTAGTFAITVK